MAMPLVLALDQGETRDELRSGLPVFHISCVNGAGAPANGNRENDSDENTPDGLIFC